MSEEAKFYRPRKKGRERGSQRDGKKRKKAEEGGWECQGQKQVQFAMAGKVSTAV